MALGYRKNRLELKQLTNRLSDMAKALGIRNFPALFNEYLASLQDVGSSTVGGNCTDFDGQEKALWCGSWTADDSGIHGKDRMGFAVTACPHPIMPVRGLINIDTGLEKVELAHRYKQITEGIVTRIVLAASFSSALVRPCSCLPFLVHLWGGSEVGKTVGLMLAASVWATPEMGHFYVKFQFNRRGKRAGCRIL